MADGGAASQDESSGPGNDYSILHIHTHIQTVLQFIINGIQTGHRWRDRSGGYSAVFQLTHIEPAVI